MAKKPTRPETTAAGGDARPMPETPGPAEARQPPPIQTVEPSRCPRCRSTARTPYYGTITRTLPGTTPAGQPFYRVTWRRTRCLTCGQARIDKTYE